MSKKDQVRVVFLALLASVWLAGARPSEAAPVLGGSMSASVSPGGTVTVSVTTLWPRRPDGTDQDGDPFESVTSLAAYTEMMVGPLANLALTSNVTVLKQTFATHHLRRQTITFDMTPNGLVAGFTYVLVWSHDGHPDGLANVPDGTPFSLMCSIRRDPTRVTQSPQIGAPLLRTAFKLSSDTPDFTQNLNATDPDQPVSYLLLDSTSVPGFPGAGPVTQVGEPGSQAYDPIDDRCGGNCPISPSPFVDSSFRVSRDAVGQVTIPSKTLNLLRDENPQAATTPYAASNDYAVALRIFDSSFLFSEAKLIVDVVRPGPRRQNLMALGGAPAEGRDPQVNSNGSVVFQGRATPGDPWRVFLYEAGRFTDLNALPGAPSTGRSARINDAGQVAFLGGTRIYLWDRTQIIDVSALPGAPVPLFGGPSSVDINLAGELAQSVIFSGPTTIGFVSRFDGTGFTSLGGSRIYTDVSLNDSGQVFARRDSPFAPGLFLFEGGNTTDLAALPGGPGTTQAFSTRAGASLNDAGQVAFRTASSLGLYDSATQSFTDLLAAPGAPPDPATITSHWLSASGELAIIVSGAAGADAVHVYDGTEFHLVAASQEAAEDVSLAGGLFAWSAIGTVLSTPRRSVFLGLPPESEFAFAESATVAGEGDGALSLVVTRSGDLTQSVSVDYAATGVTATEGADYLNGSGTLSFAPGETQRPISFPLLDDGVTEHEERLSVQLSNPSFGARLAPGLPAHPAVIVDDDPAGLVQDLMALPGAPAEGQDPDVNALGQVVFQGRTTPGGPLQVFVYDQGGFINLNALPGAPSTGRSARINDAGQVAFLGGTRIYLWDGSQLVDVSALPGAPTPLFGGPSSVAINQAGELALSVIFSGPTTISSVIHFDGSSFTSLQNTRLFSAVDINDGGQLFARRGQSFNPPGLFLFTGGMSTDLATLMGGPGTSQPFLARAGGSLSDAGQVVFRTALGLGRYEPGTPGFTDLLAASGAPAAASLLLSHWMSADGDVAVLSRVVDPAQVAPAPAVSSLRVFSGGSFQPIVSGLTDPQDVALSSAGHLVWSDLRGPASSPTRGISLTGGPPELGFAAPVVTVVGEGQGTVSLDVTRAGDLTSAVSVDYLLVGTSATAGADYVDASGTLSFAPGVLTQSITITLLDDALPESNEILVAALENPSPGVLLREDSAVVEIQDDEGGGAILTMSALEVAVGEDAGSVVLTVNRGGDPSGPALVDYFTFDLEASAPSDYGAVSGSLSFAPNELSRTITIPIVDDLLVESGERFGVALDNPGGGLIGTPPATIVTIGDNEGGAAILAFAAASSTVAEDAGSASVVVTRSGDTTGPAFVYYETLDLNAVGTAGVDYVATSGTLAFAPGETSRSITLTIIDDGVSEIDEVFGILLENPGGGSLGTPDLHVVVIPNDDPLPAQALALSHPSFSVAEGAGSIVIDVVRTGSSTGAIEVDYFTIAGAATGGQDYTDVVGTLQFADGELSRTITIPILDDALMDPAEGFELILQDATLGVSLPAPANQPIFIVDDD